MCSNEIELSLPGGTFDYLYINRHKKEKEFEPNYLASISSMGRQEDHTGATQQDLEKYS